MHKKNNTNQSVNLGRYENFVTTKILKPIIVVWFL